MRLPEINYHHLRLFFEVARCGSLRSAAVSLNLSSPTISSQIKALEDELDKKLFDRSGRGLKITLVVAPLVDEVLVQQVLVVECLVAFAPKYLVVPHQPWEQPSSIFLVLCRTLLPGTPGSRHHD